MGYYDDGNVYGHMHNENCAGKSHEEERQAAEKRIILKRQARKLLLEIREGANGAGYMLSPEDCKTLVEGLDLGV